MALKPHGRAWYERLAARQDGYFYPWRSRIDEGNGEAAYLREVRRHLGLRVDVLDVGCAHGVANATFLCHDSPPLPGEERSYDLLISRRGPLRWIRDARRVARPGAVIVMLLPEGSRDAEVPWRRLLPPPFDDAARPLGPPPLDTIRRRLAEAGLALDAVWTYDVREWFDTPRDLYDCLSFGWQPEAPSWEESRELFERIFRESAVQGSIGLPHGRTLWRAVVE